MIVLAITLVSLFIGLGFEKYRNPLYKVTTNISVSTTGEDKSTDFKYEHYYSLEAIDSLTDSLEEWIKSPVVRKEIKLATKSDFRSRSWQIWDKEGLKVRKKGPQFIEISFYTSSPKEGKVVVNKLKDKTKDFLTSYNQSGNPLFNLTNSTSALEFLAPRWSLVIFLSILWGVIIGVLIVLEKESLTHSRKRK